jgi:hypothetical protein
MDDDDDIQDEVEKGSSGDEPSDPFEDGPTDPFAVDPQPLEKLMPVDRDALSQSRDWSASFDDHEPGPVHPEVDRDPRDPFVLDIPLDTPPRPEDVVRSSEVGLFWHLEETRNGDMFMHETDIDGRRTGRFIHLDGSAPGRWGVAETDAGDVVIQRTTPDLTYTRRFEVDPRANLVP